MILPSFLHFNETCSVKCLLVSLLFYGLKQHLFCSPVWNLGRAWRKTWQCTPVFLPGKILWTEEPGGQQSMGLQESYMTQRLNHHQWGQLVDTASAVMAQRLGQKSSKGSSPYQVVGTWLLARTLGRATWIPTRSLCSVSWASSQHGCSVTRTNFPREEMEWKPRHFYDLASEVMQHHFCYVLFIRA